MCGFFTELPTELEESAMLDGWTRVAGLFEPHFYNNYVIISFKVTRGNR